MASSSSSPCSAAKASGIDAAEPMVRRVGDSGGDCIDDGAICEFDAAM